MTHLSLNGKSISCNQSITHVSVLQLLLLTIYQPLTVIFYFYSGYHALFLTLLLRFETK